MLIQLRLYRSIIHDYKYNDRLHRSENNGILFWLSEEQELVDNFEKTNPNCKVYHVIKTNTVDFGVVYDLLYVISPFPESGLIAVKSINGGLVRVY